LWSNQDKILYRGNVEEQKTGVLLKKDVYYMIERRIVEHLDEIIESFHKVWYSILTRDGSRNFVSNNEPDRPPNRDDNNREE
jgi:hypothetical protein